MSQPASRVNSEAKAPGEGSAPAPQMIQYMYYNKQKQQRGPALGAEMKYLYDQGTIDDESFVWTTGMTEWKPLKDTPALALYIHPAEPGPAVKSESLSTDDGAANPNHEGPTTNAEKKKKKKRKRRGPKTWIYVTGIPKDATVEELEEHFSKCGFIQEDALTGNPMVKLYRDEKSGEVKGDASICFVQEASVEIALSVYNQAPLRDADPKGTILTVVKADFSKSNHAKKEKEEAKEVPQEQKEKGKGKKDKTWDRRVKMRKLKQQQALSWNEEGVEDEHGLKIVVIMGLFGPKDIEDAGFLAELERSLVAECAKFGQLAKVTLIERNPKGVAIVKFHSARGAEKCVEVMDGRWFDKRQLTAHFWDGETDYRVRASEEEEKKRIESFGDWLEGKGGDSSDDAEKTAE